MIVSSIWKGVLLLEQQLYFLSMRPSAYRERSPKKMKSFFQESSHGVSPNTSNEAARLRELAIPSLDFTFTDSAGPRSQLSKENAFKYGQYSERKRVSEYVSSKGSEGFGVSDTPKTQRSSYNPTEASLTSEVIRQLVKGLQKIDRNQYARMRSPQYLTLPVSPKAGGTTPPGTQNKPTIQHIENYRQLLSPRQSKQHPPPAPSMLKTSSSKESSYVSSSSFRSEEAKENCTDAKEELQIQTPKTRYFKKDPNKKCYNTPRQKAGGDTEESSMLASQLSSKLISQKFSSKKLEDIKPKTTTANSNTFGDYIRQKITPAPDTGSSRELYFSGIIQPKEQPQYFCAPRVLPLSIKDFEMGKCRGDGKFGRVYMCRQKRTGSLFAIKQIPKHIIKKNNLVNQFTWEVKIQSFFDHPNIVKLYGFFNDANTIYLLMEYMEGGTLFDHLKKHKGGGLSEEETSKHMRQVCSAVYYMHDLQVAHRDIKPENVVLSNDVAKLCDFGWSTLTNERRSTYCGTFDYSSPEMLEGKQYDESIDLWSLGVLAYELLTGKLPFYSVSRKQTMNNIISVDQKQIVFPAQMSWEARSFIQGLLRKEPDQRREAQMLLRHPFLQKYNKDKVY